MTASKTGQAQSGPLDEEKVYRRITRRLIPFLFLAMLAAYLNRVNIGFIQASLSSDLGFSSAAYGFGAGVFFVGYLLFEVPSNLLMQKIGARRTFQRIMILWGITSASVMFVQDEWQFYVLRFLLGVFEAGFLPATLLYLTYWYPSHRRGKAMALLLTGVAISGVIGAPMSGAILSFFDGLAGMSGWQWMMLIEGLFPVCLGLMVHKFIDDRPKDAKWLSESDRSLVERRVAEDSENAAPRHSSFVEALKDHRIYALCYVYFSIATGIYLIGFWLPHLLRSTGNFAPWQLGLVVAIPYVCAAVTMVVVGAHSDRTGERRFHLATLGTIGTISIALATQSSNVFIVVVLFSIAASAVLTMPALFWALSAKFLTGVAAAGGIALINSVGNFSGFLMPTLTGWINDATGSLNMSLWINAGVVLLGVIVLLFVARDSDSKKLGPAEPVGVGNKG